MPQGPPLRPPTKDINSAPAVATAPSQVKKESDTGTDLLADLLVSMKNTKSEAPHGQASGSMGLSDPRMPGPSGDAGASGQSQVLPRMQDVLAYNASLKRKWGAAQMQDMPSTQTIVMPGPGPAPFNPR